ncbi:unnamed protein product [Leuciscus chuanchicus]
MGVCLGWVGDLGGVMWRRLRLGSGSGKILAPEGPWLVQTGPILAPKRLMDLGLMLHSPVGDG